MDGEVGAFIYVMGTPFLFSIGSCICTAGVSRFNASRYVIQTDVFVHVRIVPCYVRVTCLHDYRDTGCLGDE